MWTTKRYNKWQGTAFLNNHNDTNPYQDSADKLPRRWRDRQLVTSTPKTGHNSYFRPIVYASDPYSATITREQLEKQKRANGFGTSNPR